MLHRGRGGGIDLPAAVKSFSGLQTSCYEIYWKLQEGELAKVHDTLARLGGLADVARRVGMWCNRDVNGYGNRNSHVYDRPTVRACGRMS